NYHIEHHMFPLVPYYNLPRLHQVIRDDLPPPDRSIWSAYREMLPVIWQQFKGREVFVERPLRAQNMTTRESR
ncbi:MAG: fatty acid desaturase, partial [SAR116 cluster bacterium]|nr:fatty acid desaturase [SAR116 cluster bacterium]